MTSSESIEIEPTGPLNARIRPPGSKSLTNRMLVCAALANGHSTLEGVLDSEDTRVMVEGLRRLGIDLTIDFDKRRAEVDGGTQRLTATAAELLLANSGTSMRFLTSVAALGTGHYELRGTTRMHERPIQDLLVALQTLGADARSEQQNGCPPVIVEGRGLEGGRVTIRGDVSSQFLSGLLMVAPLARNPVEMQIEGPLVSVPYVEMTLAVMRAFGVDVEVDASLRRFCIPADVHYQGQHATIEPDASAASYFWAAAAIAGGRVTVEGLSRDSLQGDVRFVELLEKMGCRVTWKSDSISVEGATLRGIDVDMNPISDTAQTLAAVALFAEGPTRIHGIAHVRHKETDRIAALATELRKFGATVEEFEDGLRIVPATLRPAEINTYDDHRMAMSMALVGLRQPGVVIRDPGCTAKTYPGFFEDLRRVCTTATT